MIKIAICGKANSGKDTLGLIISELLLEKNLKTKQIAFADPIKKIIKIIFPETKKAYLYGPSDNRKKVIPNAFLNGQPLTYRRLLQNLGTDVCRQYNEDIWLNIMGYEIRKAEKKFGAFIVKDSRFRNEFDYLKSQGFSMLKIFRDAQLNISHQSESEQDSIRDEEFSLLINNTGTIEDLRAIIRDNLAYIA